MPEPIRFRGVTKRYGDVTALDDVDLTVHPGEFHCLVGPNGSGKTTLFELLLGLVRPTAGTVDVPAAAVGCSFQTPTFYPGLTVDENLSTFAGLADCPGHDWRTTVAETFDLDRVEARFAGDLSGGWKKKLDLALAFLGRPACVVLDEPLDDLDEVSRNHLLRFLNDYRTDERTVVVSTHRVVAFEDVADRVTVLDEGEVVLDAPVDALDSPLEDACLDLLV